MKPFKDRQTAGRSLAKALEQYAEQKDTLVLALPRGGVPVAFEVAKQLQLPLDVLLIRKLGAPGNKELALGAIALDGTCVFNRDVIRNLTIAKKDINAVIAEEKKTLRQRNKRYRHNKPMPAIKGKTIIIIDDGIATGATLKAAIVTVKAQAPAHVVVAAPVAARETLTELQTLVDDVICLGTPEPFYGVGSGYQAFPQVDDDTVCKLLAEAQAGAKQ